MILLRTFRPFRVGLAAALLALAALPGRAGADEGCRSPLADKAPDLNFKVEVSPAAWHNDKNRDQIRTLRARSGATVAPIGPHWQSIGLTLNKYVLAVEVRVEATAINSARATDAKASGYCARLDSATVRFGTRKTDAYVAREYQPGTCAHETVRQHEQRHVTIYQEAAERYAPMVEAKLREVARGLHPVRVETAQEGAERLRKMLHDELSPIFDEMGRETERANGALDTPAAYNAERKRCADW